MPEYVKKKVLLLGDGAVGKTSLIRRFVVDKFADRYIATIGTKVTKQEIRLKKEGEECYVTLMIWDVLGQRGYSAVQASSFRGSQGALIVYHVTRPETIQALAEYWIPRLYETLGKVPIVVVGNKVDLVDRRKAHEEDAEDFCSKYDSEYYLSSAKSGENVEKIFMSIGKEMMEERRIEEMDKATTFGAPSTIIEASDKIIMDFCNQFGGMESGMPILREQFAKAGLDIKAPTKEGLIKVIGFLAEVESNLKDQATVSRNRARRLSIVKNAR